MVESMAKQASSEQTAEKIRKLVMADFKAHLIFWLLAIFGLALDLWSKSAVFNWLDTLESYSVIDGFLQLIRAQNPGAAWGIFPEKTFFLIGVASIALIVIIILFLFSGKQPRVIQVAMGFFAAGISGNLYDRIFKNGQVRDFIDAYYHDVHWPTFNVADSLLCIGVGLLIISTIFTGKPAQKHDQPQK
jgi:signal peptidase II